MLTDEIVTLFAELHAGSQDAYGSELGSCVRTDTPSWADYRQRIHNHLTGIEPMGVYPMTRTADGWTVRWGCVDFDEGEHESFIHASNLQAVLSELDITSWVCRSRSKGFHVWVYAAEAIDAPLMRRSLLAATQIAKAPTKEINPKQETLEVGQLGNYVRLEYPGHLGDDPDYTRRVALVSGEPIMLEEFTLAAHAARVAATELERVAPLYREPKVEFRPRKVRVWPSAETTMSPLTRHIFEHGPYTENGEHDRSAALWRLTNLLLEDGFSSSEALNAVNDADKRWGKHHDRNTPEYLEKMVDKVYGQ